MYLAVVLDAFSRRVVGWSIADHIRSELVVDAVQMAIWRRQPPTGQTVAHSDHGSQYTSLGVRAPAARRRPARLDGLDRRLLRQLRRRELLRHPAARAARRAPLGRPAASSPPRSSNGSKAGTTRAAGTATADMLSPIDYEAGTPPPPPRHDQPNQPSAETGDAHPRKAVDKRQGGRPGERAIGFGLGGFGLAPVPSVPLLVWCRVGRVGVKRRSHLGLVAAGGGGCSLDRLTPTRVGEPGGQVTGGTSSATIGFG